MSVPRIGAVILAAGKGTRLKSDLPKVLHEVCGRPMLAYVLDACREAGVRRCLTVVGHGQDLVRQTFAADTDIVWVEQTPQLGTGHAVMVCRPYLNDFEHVLVLAGDGPLIRSHTIEQLLRRHLEAQAAATLATAILEDPTGYGRIWRDSDGHLLGIVEHGDASPEQRRIREVNPSYYCFRTADLLPALEQLRPNNVKQEYYITDTLAILLKSGRRVEAVSAVPPEDVYSINSRQDLALVNDVMRRRVLNKLMDAGVTIVDPATTWIDARAEIGPDTIIRPLVHIHGPARIGRNCRIGPLVHLDGVVRVADGAIIGPASGAGA